MNKKELKLIRDKSITELEKQVAENIKKLRKLEPRILAGKEKNVRSIKNLRRDIAQTLSILREKSIVEERSNK